MKKLRNDLILIVAVLVLCAGLFTGWYFLTRNRGQKAVVYHGDEVVMTLNLYKKQTVTVQGDISLVRISTDFGYVWVEESGCTNQICVNMGRKSRENETITCLPNKIYIVIEGGK